MKMLTLKVPSLNALSTACRSSELYYLDLNHMQIYPKEFELKIVHLTKTRRIGQEPVKLIFSQFENEMTDVRKHILQYLKETEPLRKGKLNFFLVFLNLINLSGLSKLLDG